MNLPRYAFLDTMVNRHEGNWPLPHLPPRAVDVLLRALRMLVTAFGCCGILAIVMILLAVLCGALGWSTVGGVFLTIGGVSLVACFTSTLLMITGMCLIDLFS